MVMKSVLAEIVDGRLLLPGDVLTMFPAGVPLRVITDSERGTVCIFVKDPLTVSPQTEDLMEALGSLSEGLTWDDYVAPVSDDALRKQKGERGAE